MADIINDKHIEVTELEGDALYTSPYQQSNNFHHAILQTYGGSSLSYDQPRSSLSGYKPQFNITTG